jgi:hypothetical protein
VLHAVELNSFNRTSSAIPVLVRPIFNVDDLLLLLFLVTGIKLSPPLAPLICVPYESRAQFVEMLISRRN